MRFVEQEKKLVIIHDPKVVELIGKFPVKDSELIAYIEGAKALGNRQALQVVEGLILVKGIKTKKTALTYQAAMTVYSELLEAIGIEVEHAIEEAHV